MTSKRLFVAGFAEGMTIGHNLIGGCLAVCYSKTLGVGIILMAFGWLAVKWRWET